MASIKCGNCTETHDSAQAVRECYATNAKRQQVAVVIGAQGVSSRINPNDPETASSDEVAATVAALGIVQTEPMATEKQIAFIKKLRQERGLEPIGSFEHWTKASSSAHIDSLMKMPKKVAIAVSNGAVKSEPEDGIYQTATSIYKVYKMVHGSGRQGVKILHVEEKEDGKKSGKFVYLGLATKYLPADAAKMTLEEAKEFGKIYGFCVKCAATLTDETSIANGIGPICGGRDW